MLLFDQVDHFSDGNPAIIATIICIYILIMGMISYPDYNRIFSACKSGLRRLLTGNRTDIVFCICCSIAIFVICTIFLTNGPGLSPDSLNYIATGDNLHSGENFMQGYANKAVYSLWPPLYPILISFLMNFGLTPEASAALIPVISFALLVFPVFYLGKKIGNRILAYTGCISCVVFQPLIFVSSYAWTEMPFILLSSMSLLCMTEYYSSKNDPLRHFKWVN
jgi:4-amino-4-deoxy-L-arabinose transferase-like glycosyltransferase